MKIVIKLIISCVLCLLSVFVLYIAGILIFGLITEYHPDTEEVIIPENKSKSDIGVSDTLTLLSWNIGYAGLGKEMDFFYENGKMVRPSTSQHEIYLKGISEFIEKYSNTGFIFLQEVDFKSKRSYKTNEFDLLKEILPSHNAVSAINYKSGFIPIPLQNPMGRVNSGMATFSEYQLKNTKRLVTPGKHKWPKRMFMLKRCFLISRIDAANGKNLVLINIHNSAFKDEKKLREAELEMLRSVILKEYRLGNYVVVGGDWNQNPPGMDVTNIGKYISKDAWPIPEGYVPAGWNWAYDPGLPTNRDVNKPFDFTRTTTTILDYFLASPNIEVLNVKTFDLEFEYSDHQPVLLTFKLK
ncbi:MAG: endonuclease/exonuclease/phosphatase family protein [Bacteroidales bacterium]|nr:endonuclease/exonuclease/phosphatase family protein [Bacteroidales bacterium]